MIQDIYNGMKEKSTRATSYGASDCECIVIVGSMNLERRGDLK